MDGRKEAEREALARNGECVFLGLPILADSTPLYDLPHEHATVGDGSIMRFYCRKLDARVTLGYCGRCPHFQPLKDGDGPVVVGITTSPRDPPTIQETTEALAKAGFKTSPVLVCDDRDLGARQGPFGAFYSLMTQLAMRFPHTGAYLYCQDDVLVSPKVRDWLKSLKIPLNAAVWIASFYRPHAYRGLSGGQINEGYAGSQGACTYLFSPAALRDLLSDPWVLRWRWRGEDGWRRIDQVVGAWASKFGGIIYPPESLAEHIGKVSSTYKHNPEGTQPCQE
jgi:hypothetical protein